MANIECKKFKDMDLKGGTMIEGFPGVGLVSAITATYLIEHLKLDQICALDSDDFPPTSMVYAKKPKFPARIYGCDKTRIGVFISEFSPQPLLQRPIAKKLLEWGAENRIKRIIATEGLPVDTGKDAGDSTPEREIKVYGVGSTDNARADLEKAGIEQLETGMIYGVSGALLNEGRWQNFDVITLLVEAYESMPDGYAAARILEAIDVLLPEVKIETKPLYERSAGFEDNLRRLRKQAVPPMPDTYKDMYQ